VSDAPLDAEAAFVRYEAIRPRLPAAAFPATSIRAATLADVADRYDAFVLDAFGVLNVGDTPIPGAVARMAELRRLGKRLVVLTNAASYPRATALAKYRRLGFDFTADEVVSSRDVAVARLAEVAPNLVWSAITAGDDSFADIPASVTDLIDGSADWDRAEGFLFLSSARWDAALQARLTETLRRRPRPLVVANPDLVAPREGGLTAEPGLYAHDIADALRVHPIWYGKPFRDAFVEAALRLGNPPAHRIAMVGDTLHTDVLGGRAAGMGTVLIAAHGLFAGRDVTPYITRSGIRPEVIATTT
jgi:HAD superfamily hydrolase (TIGR01459 family)